MKFKVNQKDKKYSVSELVGYGHDEQGSFSIAGVVDWQESGRVAFNLVTILEITYHHSYTKNPNDHSTTEGG